VQPKKLPSQGKLWRKTPSPRRIGSRYPLGLCGGLSFFWILFFPFFDYFPSFSLFFSFIFFLSFFFDLPHQETGMGVTERRQRDGCAHEVANG
jgi:hypothetical protein